ncbi:MAG: hypothetical protein K0S71_1288 [Clostridia bacterium]|jgi:glycosyltransferase involved in cell wall biosynthesis|nr:hypothetical protein [Clostridia bacterium]
MDILVVSDSHITKQKDGTYWCRTAIHGYDFWKRYLSAFDRVKVVSRVLNIDYVDLDNHIRVDGPGVEIIDLPFVRGAKEYLRNYFRFKSEIKKVISDEACAIFRLPSIPAFMVLKEFKKTNKPYLFEIIADPYDAYSVNFFAQKYYTKKLKNETLKANGVSYVTEKTLQRKYPSYSIKNGPNEKHFDTYYSSIDLKGDFFSEKRIYPKFIKSLKIVHLASSINNDNKGHVTLLKTVYSLKKKGYNVSLECIGDGDMRSYYEDMATTLGIKDIVNFVGLFSSINDLREVMLKADIFLFPTKAEGLPRAIIEAMALGLPCLSTYVGGVPELLDERYLFHPDDVEGFSIKIGQLINNPSELEEMSEVNINKAKEFRKEILDSKRNNFYYKLKELAEATE